MPFVSDATLPGLLAARLESGCAGCRFSRDGAQVAFGLDSGDVILLSLASGQAVTRDIHDGPVTCLAAGVQGWITGGEDGRVIRLDPDGAALELAAFSDQPVTAVAAGADGGLLAAAAGNRLALLSPTGRPAVFLADAPSAVTALAVTDDGRALAAGYQDGLTVHAPPRQGLPGHVLEGAGDNLALAFSPDAGCLACATGDHTVRVYDLDRSAGAVLDGYPANVRGLSFAHDGSLLWTGGEQAFVGWPIGPLDEGTPRRAVVFGNFLGLLGAVAAHPVMPLVAGGVDGGEVVIGSPARNGAARLTSVAGKRFTGLVWSPDGRHLAGCTDGGGAFCLDLTARA